MYKHLFLFSFFGFLSLSLGAQTAIDFSTQVQPIFTSYCTGCHNSGFSAGGVDLSSYDGVLNSTGASCVELVVVPQDDVGSSLVTKIDATVPLCGGGVMPPSGPGPTPAEINTIRTWITQGAAPADPAGATFYTNFVDPVFSTGGVCTGCHNSGFPTSGVDLSSQAGLLASTGAMCGQTILPGNAANSPLMSKIDPNIPVCAGNPMPPPAGGVITRAQYNTVAQWIISLASLPVEILGFEAQYERNLSQVKLIWAAEEDQSTEFYQIERATDWNDFEVIGNAQPQDQIGLHQYQWFDASPLNGKLYYRLKVVDINGESSYSDIVQVQVEDAQSKVLLYPNPSSNLVNLELFSPNQATVMISIQNLTGQLIWSEQLEMRQSHQRFKIETQDWPRGVYLVRIADEADLTQSIKLIVD